MSKVITFSRTYAGGETLFVEKFLTSMRYDYKDIKYLHRLLRLNNKSTNAGKLTFTQITEFFDSLKDVNSMKIHTIRSGFRFKSGELFSPRVWSGLPYRSPQIIFWDDVECDVQKIEISDFKVKIDGREIDKMETYHLAHNDGFNDLVSFWSWFQDDFKGQIIGW